ncbi:MAG: hypothetical protein AAFV88_04350 [Planctomycetota bacterium]
MLTPDQVHDLVNLTLSLFKRRSWTDIALDYQHYVASKLITDKAVIEQGGKDINFKLKTKNTGNARNTGLFAQDSSKVEDNTIECSVPWTKQTGNFSYDVDEEIFQSSREMIISHLKMEEHSALSDIAELNETNLWSAPLNPQDKRPYGIPFWMQKDPTTEPEGGFHGGNPSGFSSGAGGISSNDYPKWRNYTFGYSQVTTNDFVKKVKRALAMTFFEAPVPHPELGYGDADHCMYTTYRVQDALERLAESRNDNLGNDLARFINQGVIGGVPVKWVPYLETNDTSDPVYGINWRVFRPFVKRGCNNRRSKPMPAPGHTQHTVRTVHYDTWMNYICYNRRLLFVGSK